MSAQTYHLEMRWPITNPDERLDALKQQARHDLAHTLAAHRLHVAGRIGWAITHGGEPALTAVLSVTGPAGLPRTITTHEAAEAEKAA